MELSLVVHTKFGHASLAIWPRGRPMFGVAYTSHTGMVVDWRDRTYFFSGPVYEIARKYQRGWPVRMP